MKSRTEFLMWWDNEEKNMVSDSYGDSNNKYHAWAAWHEQQYRIDQLEREKAELLEALKEIKAECEDAPSLGYHGYVIGRSSRALAISGGKV